MQRVATNQLTGARDACLSKTHLQNIRNVCRRLDAILPCSNNVNRLGELYRWLNINIVMHRFIMIKGSHHGPFFLFLVRGGFPKMRMTKLTMLSMMKRWREWWWWYQSKGVAGTLLWGFLLARDKTKKTLELHTWWWGGGVKKQGCKLGGCDSFLRNYPLTHWQG